MRDPLPSVLERRSVTVSYPSHPAVDAFFEQLGGALSVADEAAFYVSSALTGTLTTHTPTLPRSRRGPPGTESPADDAERYERGLFQAVGRALGDETRSLQRLAADHETPKGNNERIRTAWFDQANAATLNSALAGLLTDLRCSDSELGPRPRRETTVP